MSFADQLFVLIVIYDDRCTEVLPLRPFLLSALVQLLLDILWALVVHENLPMLLFLLLRRKVLAVLALYHFLVVVNEVKASYSFSPGSAFQTVSRSFVQTRLA